MAAKGKVIPARYEREEFRAINRVIQAPSGYCFWGIFFSAELSLGLLDGDR